MMIDLINNNRESLIFRRRIRKLEKEMKELTRILKSIDKKLDNLDKLEKLESIDQTLDMFIELAIPVFNIAQTKSPQAKKLKEYLEMKKLGEM